MRFAGPRLLSFLTNKPIPLQGGEMSPYRVTGEAQRFRQFRNRMSLAAKKKDDLAPRTIEKPLGKL